MSLTKVTSNVINDVDASKLTGSIADARVPASAVTQHSDTSSIENDIAVLALQNAINGNMTAHGLNNYWIEQFENSDHITALTNTVRTTSEFVASMASDVTIPVSSDWVTTWDGGGEWPATTGGIDNTGGDSGISSGVVLSGDFIVQFTGTGGLSTYSSCFGVHDVANDSSRATNQRLGMDGSGIASYYWGSEGAVPHRHRYGNANDDSGTYTYADGSVVKITRTSGVIKFYDDGTLVHTYSTSNTNNMRFFIAAGGSPFNQNYDDISFTIPVATSATGSFTSTTITPQDSASKSSLGLCLLYKNNAGTNTLNTDIIAKVSADNGSNYSTCVLASKGTFSTGINIAIAPAISVTAGTQLKYKIEFANQSDGSKEGQIHGVALSY